MTARKVTSDIILGFTGIVYMKNLGPLDLNITLVKGSGMFVTILNGCILVLGIYLWLMALAFSIQLILNTLYVLFCLITRVEPHAIINLHWYHFIPVGSNTRTGLTMQQHFDIRNVMDDIRTYKNSSHGPDKY